MSPGLVTTSPHLTASPRPLWLSWSPELAVNLNISSSALSAPCRPERLFLFLRVCIIQQLQVSVSALDKHSCTHTAKYWLSQGLLGQRLTVRVRGNGEGCCSDLGAGPRSPAKQADAIWMNLQPKESRPASFSSSP